MKKIEAASVIEIWTAGYLNHPETRLEQDQKIKILQVETADISGESVLIEFVRLRKED